ncbi:acyl-CoA dehydrogenase family protein [Kitasatospora herbaricolor]|uniref:Hydrolase n=1 Tax=Kitasatospora herbaricolor TaxID=68217 RepID=A0ABZ1WCW1_9ACTN|nr:acyl-CoA dehydrogenase family protein [Kitasatospora herbaricolor]
MANSVTSGPDLVEAAADVAKTAAELAGEAERDRRLDARVVRAVLDAGFARHFVPARWGGTAGTFTAVTEAVATVGQGCTSAAWAASLTASLGRMAAYLPAAGQQELWQDGPDPLIVGALMPLGKAEPDADGWRISGRWPYVSVIEYSDWALVCAVTTDEARQARFFAVPRASYRIVETWESVGMRGTGSNTLVIEDVLVPAARSFGRDTVTGGAAEDAEAACHRVPLKAVNGLCFATPVLGAARGALDAWTDETALRAAGAPGGIPAASAAVLARAGGEIDAAGLLLDRAARAADQERVTALDVARSTRDCALAADLALAAVNRLFRAGGTRAQQDSSALQRHWRDANSAASHIVLQFDPAAKAYADEVFALR